MNEKKQNQSMIPGEVPINNRSLKRDTKDMDEI